MIRLGVLISGSGTTLENLLARIADGRLRGVTIAGVVSSRGGVRGVSVARQGRLEPHIIRRREFPAVEQFSAAVAKALDLMNVDLVVMAGFLCLWKVPERYRGRVINIHPALLPGVGGQGMYGEHVHRAVLASGADHSGCTVHLVDDEYDHGPVIARSRVPVLPDDTPEALAARVQAAERELLPSVIQSIVDHGLQWIHQQIDSTGSDADSPSTRQ